MTDLFTTEKFDRERISRSKRSPNLTMRGVRWTGEEIQLLLQHWPNVKRCCELTGRTSHACARKAQELGLRKPYNRWTPADKIWLRNNWRQVTRERLLARFPGRTYDCIVHKARSMQLPVRGMPPPVVCGHPVVDAIRAYAYEHGITFKQLDELAGTRRYWQSNSPLTCDLRYVSQQMIDTVKVLGGYFNVVFDKT